MLPVVLLAGGMATRMRPITENIPKSMLEVAGRPFIAHQLCLLKNKGIEHVILCVGYLGEMIESYLNANEGFGLKTTFSYDGNMLLGTGGAIKNIGDKLPDAFFVLYGDSYLDIDYKKTEKAYHQSHKKAMMTVYKNDGKWDTSNVVFINNEIVRYNKKNKTEDMNYIDYGLGIFNKQVFEDHNEAVFDLACVYEQLVAEKQLFGYEVFNRFYEIGSKEGLKELEDKLKSLRCSL